MARKAFGAKPLSYPQPVWIISTYDENGNIDAMNAAWTGISDYEEVFLCLSHGHKTVKNILANKAFVVSMAQADYVDECDFVGVVSANKDKDKMKKSGFTFSKAPTVNAPVINELSISMECLLKSYDIETGHMFATIANVSVDEKALDENGNVDYRKVRPITFDPFNNKYIELGEIAGDAFKAGLRLK